MSDRGPVVVNSAAYGDRLADGLRTAAPDEAFVVPAPDVPAPADAEILVTLLDDADALRRLLVPSVRWAHVLGAGVDGFPFDALGDRPLTCSRGAAAPAIAEWALAVMLAFEKHLPGSWVTSPPPGRWGAAGLGGLAGRSVGLVGLGAIGTAVARLAQAFSMEVRALRRRPGAAPVPGVEMEASLAGLLARSDHVVIAAPATPATHHLFDQAAFAAIRPGMHLVNVARGELVDQDALRNALDGGRLAMASLDTVDPEPLPAGHWLYSHPGVRLSPHVSWSAPSTMPRTVELFTDNLKRYRAGQDLAGLVDPAAGY